VSGVIFASGSIRQVRHSFSCPLRWADLDLLGHVNNVRYADYLREARADLLRAAGVDLGLAGPRVVRQELTFRAPLLFGAEPIVVDCWLTGLSAAGASIAYDVHDGAADGRRTYLLARSAVTARAADGTARPFTAQEQVALASYVEEGEPAGATSGVSVRSAPERGYPLVVRSSDLDVTGHASEVAFVEFFQEARIGFFNYLLHELPDTARLRWVVAQTDIDLLAPIAPRPSAYGCFSRLAKVGNKSLVIESVIRDDDGTDLATARVVLVVFDPATQRATEPPPGYRTLLEGMVTDG